MRFLVCSISMSLIGLIFIMITSFLSKRYSNKCIYYSWMIVVVGLLIPFRPQFDNALIKFIKPLGTISGTVNYDAITTVGKNLIGYSVDWFRIIGVMWITGAVIFFFYLLLRQRSFNHMVKRWSVEIEDLRLLKLLQDIQYEMDIFVPIKFKVCSCITTPMVTGFFSPVVLLPSIDISTDSMLLILRHELIHFKRGDIWYKLLTLAANAIHWFNPVVYLISQEISTRCEISCDEEVIKGSNLNIRRSYGETIISTAKSSSAFNTALSTSFYDSNRNIKQRIYSIMDTGKKKGGTLLATCILVGTLCTGVVFAYDDRAMDTSIATMKNIIIPSTYVMPAQYHNETDVKAQVVNDNRYSLHMKSLIYEERESSIYQIGMSDENKSTYSSVSLNNAVDYKDSQKKKSTLLNNTDSSVGLESAIYKIAPRLTLISYF